jgi:segregation and condensation protein A
MSIETLNRAPTMGVTNTEIPASTGYRVSLPEFEGPLDLLLHLCQTHELDILHISISFIAGKYIEYLELMEGMSVEIAAEYLVMAAHLAYLKSRELVPTPEPMESNEEAEEALDPREELIKRLLEYQKYKNAAENLGNRPIEGRNVFVRGVPREDGGEAGFADHSIWKLLEHWAGMLKTAKPELTHDVVMDRVSITDRINQIVDLLEAGKGMVRFEDLLGKDIGEYQLRHKIVVSLLAVLELARLRVLRVMREEATETFFLVQVADGDLEAARHLIVTSGNTEAAEGSPIPTIASPEPAVESAGALAEEGLTVETLLSSEPATIEELHSMTEEIEGMEGPAVEEQAAIESFNQPNQCDVASFSSLPIEVRGEPLDDSSPTLAEHGEQGSDGETQEKQ